MYFYKFEILQQFVKDRQSTIQCQKSYQMVNVLGLIDDVMDRWDVLPRDSYDEDTVFNQYFSDSIGEKMKKNNYEIKIEAGANVGSIVIGSSITRSFNKIEKSNISEELKELVRALTLAVQDIAKELPKDQAEESGRDLETFVNEVTSPSPRESWYRLSADGLKRAAEKVGAIGTPVIDLATKIIMLLLTVAPPTS